MESHIYNDPVIVADAEARDEPTTGEDEMRSILPDPDIDSHLALQSAQAVANGSKPRLPRLGQVKYTVKATEVELPDAGASLVLQKPTVRTILAMQAQVDSENATAGEMFTSAITLVAGMLVEPELTEEELREQVDQMTFSDWQHLQDKAMELAGLGGETRRQTEAEFQGPGERS